MKAIMLSIRPEWCEKIANGQKTVEVRKTKPKLETPFKCYIYCTKPKFDHEDFIVVNDGTENALCFYGGGKVIGEFICDFFDGFTPTDRGVKFKRFSALYQSCLSVKEICGYLNGKKGYGWHISGFVLYDKPKELSEFERPCPYQNECIFCEYYDEGSYIGGEPPSCNWEGCNIIRPPQSWCYVEEL